VIFDSSTVVNCRLIGYENRTLAAEDFDNDCVDGGEGGTTRLTVELTTLISRAD
jgi:hypothetical protein